MPRSLPLKDLDIRQKEALLPSAILHILGVGDIRGQPHDNFIEHYV